MVLQLQPFTAHQTQQSTLFGHNYIIIVRKFNPSEEMDSWDDNDEDYTVDYFMPLQIGWDTTYQSMNVKTCVSNTTINSFWP